MQENVKRIEEHLFDVDLLVRRELARFWTLHQRYGGMIRYTRGLCAEMHLVETWYARKVAHVMRDVDMARTRALYEHHYGERPPVQWWQCRPSATLTIDFELLSIDYCEIDFDLSRNVGDLYDFVAKRYEMPRGVFRLICSGRTLRDMSKPVNRYVYAGQKVIVRAERGRMNDFLDASCRVLKRHVVTYSPDERIASSPLLLQACLRAETLGAGLAPPERLELACYLLLRERYADDEVRITRALQRRWNLVDPSKSRTVKYAVDDAEMCETRELYTYHFGTEPDPYWWQCTLPERATFLYVARQGDPFEFIGFLGLCIKCDFDIPSDQFLWVCDGRMIHRDVDVFKYATDPKSVYVFSVTHASEGGAPAL